MNKLGSWLIVIRLSSSSSA